MKAFHLLVLLVFLFTSCKDEMETPAQLMAKKLNADISLEKPNIQGISVYNIYDNTKQIYFGTSYGITSDGFIVITNGTESATFNLGELKSYKITPIALVLFY